MPKKKDDKDELDEVDWLKAVKENSD